jgi:hypothetical protein
LPLTLYFTWHTVEAFSTDLETFFSNADTFFLEYSYNSGLVEEHERLYNDLSNGKVSAWQVSKTMSLLDTGTDPAFYAKLCEMIYNKRKRIGLERSPLNASEAKQMLADIHLNGSIEDKLNTYKESLEFRARCEKKRDEKFASQLAEYCKENSASEILVMWGAMHQRPLEEFLKVQNVQFKSRQSHSPMYIHTESEIISKLETDEATDRRELEFAIAEQIELKRRYNPKTLKIAELTQVQRQLRQLPHEDLRTRYLA